MGVYISEQLAMFLRSIALGAVLGLVYDLLAVLRRLGGGVWGALLDGLYCVLAAAALFFFVMAGDGELRIFILAGTLGGAVLFFCLLSRPLRPLWALWLQIFLAPLYMLGGLWKKCRRFLKKLFSFGRSWVTIRYSHWSRRRPPAPQEGDEAMAPEKKEKKRKRPSGKLTALILIVMLVGIGVQILHLYGQLRTAKAEEALYAARLADLEATNGRLAEDIANRDNMDLIEDIARNELGMACEGEKVFIFSK